MSKQDSISPTAPSMAHPACSPNPILTLKSCLPVIEKREAEEIREKRRSEKRRRKNKINERTEDGE
jgi:hypothetical protein